MINKKFLKPLTTFNVKGRLGTSDIKSGEMYLNKRDSTLEEH